MHIGIITQGYFPVIGGVSEHVWNLGRELSRAGQDVTIVTGRAREADDRGLRVVRLGVQVPVVSNGANVYVTLAWRLGHALRRLEARERFDVLHIHSPLDPILPLAATRAMRTPKVGTHHSARDSKSGVDFIPILLHRYLAESAARIDRHVAVSPAAQDWIQRYFRDVQFDIVPHGIDAVRFSPRVEKLPEYDDDVFTILFVGRMDPRKGAKHLFAALPHLERHLERYRVVVVGGSWMRRYYDALIPPELRSRVEFVGFVSADMLPRYYRTADVYVSPATGNESFGIVLLEAMASGTPVVASDIPGYRAVLTDGLEGLLAAPRDPESIADAIVKIQQDSKLQERMGVAGRARAESFSWARMVQQLLPIFESAAGRG